MSIPLYVCDSLCYGGSGKIIQFKRLHTLFSPETMGAGTKASAAVKVTYKDVKTPIVTIEDAIKRKSFHPNPPPPKSVGDAKGKTREKKVPLE